MSRKNGAAKQVIPLPARGNGAGKNEHLTATIPRELWVELDHAAAWLSVHPHWLNKSRIITDALRSYLVKLRRAHNHGKPFGPPPPEFPGHQPGRPRKNEA